VEWVSRLRSEPTERTRTTTGKPLAPATVRKVYQLFAASMEAAVTARYIGLSPCRDVPLPKVAREPMRFLTREEVVRLADAIDPRYRALVFVLAYGGLRIGEAAALTTERVDLAKRQLHVVQTVSWVKGHHHLHEPKTAAGRRKVGLPSLVAEELSTHLGRLETGEEFPPSGGRERKRYQRLSFASEASAKGLAFPSLEGGYLQPTQFRARQFAPAVKAAGLDGLRIHDLRHTAVSFWIAQGADPKRIAARAGHASTSFTYDRYGNLFPDSEDDLMDRLDAFARGADEDTNVVSLR
jgi:integrase